MLPLIAAAGAGAALQGVNSNNSTGAASSQSQSAQFQQLMQAMQQGQVSLKDLMGLSGSALQNKLKSLTPQQQQELLQKLLGSKVTVQTASGQNMTGQVSSVGSQGLNINGTNYTLGQLTAINQIPATS